MLGPWGTIIFYQCSNIKFYVYYSNIIIVLGIPDE